SNDLIGARYRKCPARSVCGPAAVRNAGKCDRIGPSMGSAVAPIRGAVPPLSSTAQERFMVAKLSEPKIITESDIDPRHDWSRAIYAPGTMAVDFEERIDFRRLHRYRLARTRQALKNSDLGAILTFD